MKIQSLILILIMIANVLALNPERTWAQSQDTVPRSTCMAIAQIPFPPYRPRPDIPVVKLASTQGDFRRFVQPASNQELGKWDVGITYVTHSTFRIENTQGLSIATDYSGFAGRGIVPDVVTMNHAHATHYTIAPDPAIPHVLRGWGEDGKPARHLLEIDGAIIRNVTTDINNDWVGYEPDGNSIFIFEMAGLCIGHLGHLHHRLTDDHYAKIGRLDVVMVPVDGGATLNLNDMTDIVTRLRASIILPMHWFGQWSLERFLERIRDRYPVEIISEGSIIVSLNNLPPSPVVKVLLPQSGSSFFSDD